MARGLNSTSMVVMEGSQGVAPLGAALDAASFERVHVLMLDAVVAQAAPGLATFTDGTQLTDVMATVDMSQVGNQLHVNWASGLRLYPGRALGVGNSLFVQIPAGGVIAVHVTYEVK